MSSTSATSPRLRLEPAQRRALIIAAASELFAAQGYDGASMRAIAKAAGVTTPMLYRHFASKAALYTALLNEHARALLDHWANPDPSASRQERFSEAVEGFFSWIEENEQAWRMLFLDSPKDEGVAAAQREIQDRAGAAAAALFAQVSSFDVSAPLDKARLDEFFAEAVKTAVNGIAVWWGQNSDVSREALVALTSDVLWRGLERVTGARTGTGLVEP